MSDEPAFLAAIAATPADDTPRLVFADWLDEHDQPDRAEFIRVQVELARMGPDIAARSSPRRAELSERERKLFEADAARTLAWFGLPRPWSRVVRLTPFDPEPHDYPYAVARRGFLDRVRCRGNVWVEHAAEIGRHPVTLATLTSVPLLTGDENGVEVFGDPERKRFAWVDVRAAWHEGDPERESGAGVIVPLMRLRWPAVEFTWIGGIV